MSALNTMGMKYFALVFALGCSGSAHAVGLDFSMTAHMFYETHFSSWDEGNFDFYYSHYATWQSQAKREILRDDFVETTFGNNGFSYHIYSYGSDSVDRYSNSSSNRFGNGSLTGSFVIHSAGNYYVDASIFRGGARAGNYLLNQLTREDGSQLIYLTDTGEHHSTQFLAAGTYTFGAIYHSSADRLIYDGEAWQHIRLSVQAVPEPGTLLALSAGTCWLRRKRKVSETRGSQ